MQFAFIPLPRELSCKEQVDENKLNLLKMHSPGAEDSVEFKAYESQGRHSRSQGLHKLVFETKLALASRRGRSRGLQSLLNIVFFPRLPFQ